MEAITLAESQERGALEKVVKLGQQTFLDVGNALLTLKAKKLYRNDYETFEEYCQNVFGWSANYGSRLVRAAEVVQSVPIGTVQNESQARALSRVPAASRPAVLAAAGEKPTAKAIEHAAKQIIIPPSAALPEPAPALAGIDTSKLIELTPKASDLLELALRVRDDMDGLVDCIKGHNCDIQTLADVLKTLGDTRAALVAYQLEIKRG